MSTVYKTKLSVDGGTLPEEAALVAEDHRKNGRGSHPRSESSDVPKGNGRSPNSVVNATEVSCAKSTRCCIGEGNTLAVGKDPI